MNLTPKQAALIVRAHMSCGLTRAQAIARLRAVAAKGAPMPTPPNAPTMGMKASKGPK
jgi:hypothetical protein